MPLLMWLGSSVAGDAGPFLAAPLLGALGVIATYFLGARIHNPTTGLVGAAFLASSPAWLFQIVQPMSDVPAAALWTCALLAATTGAAAIAGITAALALLIRPNLFPLAASAAIVLFAWTHDSLPEFSLRTRTRRAFVFAITASLGIVGVATMQWRLYGHPFASGHGSFTELFAVGNIPANVHDYSVRMLRGEMPVLIVAASCLAALILTRRSTSLPPIARACRLLLITAVPVLICYVPYGVFPDWSYLRFLLPAFPFAFIVVGTLVSEASDCVPSQARGVVLVLTLVAVVSANVTIAKREATFDLHTYESRYQTAGRYLEAVLPRDVVIVTSQQSVGAHFYTGLPILRWDLLNADLDAALGTLAGLGRHPVLLVEDWEEPLLRVRFPTSKVARLDWRSRAIFGTTTRVRYVDPDDREDDAADSAGPKGPALPANGPALRPRGPTFQDRLP
ncbi:MAG TPA: hypothetical protein VKB50_06690 [Vicinamibacterales bacterium]|nr:hypothetical protein [Vicinamibacterales bacterium]